MKTVRRGGCLLAAALTVWGLGASEGLAQDQELDSQFGGQGEEAAVDTVPGAGVSRESTPTAEPSIVLDGSLAPDPSGTTTSP